MTFFFRLYFVFLIAATACGNLPWSDPQSKKHPEQVHSQANPKKEQPTSSPSLRAVVFSDYMTMGQRLALLREVRGETSVLFSRRVGMEADYLKFIEADLLIPAQEELKMIAKRLSVPLSLLDRSDSVEKAVTEINRRNGSADGIVYLHDGEMTLQSRLAACLRASGWSAEDLSKSSDLPIELVRYILQKPGARPAELVVNKISRALGVDKELLRRELTPEASVPLGPTVSMGSMLRTLRHKNFKSMSIKEVAKETGLSTQSIYMQEISHTFPSTRTLKMLAELYGVTLLSEIERGSLLRQWREKRRMTMEKLAASLNVSLQTISSWERGKYQMRQKHLQVLSEKYGLHHAYFYPDFYKAAVLSLARAPGISRLKTR